MSAQVNGTGNSAEDWAALLLQDVGAPVTQNNVNNILAWMMSEEPNSDWWDRNNPLNASVGTDSTDGLGSYPDLATAAQYTAGMINQGNMAGIRQALVSNASYGAFVSAVVASPWASSHYNGGRNFTALGVANGGTVAPETFNMAGTPVSSLSSTGQAVNSLGTPTGSSGAPIADPAMYTTMSNVIAYINQNYPDMSWALSIPDIAGFLEQAVQSALEATPAGQSPTGLSEGALMQQIEQLPWWRDQSAAMQQYLVNKAINPADYNPGSAFGISGSVLSNMVGTVTNMAGTYGVNLTADQAETIALQAVENGWTAGSPQLQSAIAQTISVSGNPYTGNGSSTYELLNSPNGLIANANAYAQYLSDGTLQTWAQQIAAGNQSMQSYQAYLSQLASAQYPTLAQGLAGGQSVTALLQSQINAMANLLEVDPTQIENGILTNPQYSKILTGGSSPTVKTAPGNSPTSGQTGGIQVPAPMTTSEVQQYTRSLPQWRTTQNARDTSAQATASILQAFGASPVQ